MGWLHTSPPALVWTTPTALDDLHALTRLLEHTTLHTRYQEEVDRQAGIPTDRLHFQATGTDVIAIGNEASANQGWCRGMILLTPARLGFDDAYLVKILVALKDHPV